MSEQKYKEFWVDPCSWSSQTDPTLSHDAYISENPSGYTDKEKLIHVITYDAYLEMKQEAMKLREALISYTTQLWKDEPPGRAKELGCRADNAIMEFVNKLKKMEGW